jgi:superfamily II DNA helicase RecQ
VAYDGKYESPAELLLDESLSRDEKVKMLKQWRNDEKDLIRAAEEGMQNDDLPDILKEVKKALIALREPSVDE